MNTPESTPMKPHFTRQIEEIDLTGSPEPRRPQKHVSEPSTSGEPDADHLQRTHFDLELYVLNHQQSRKDSTNIWHRDADGSVRAEEYEDLLTYLRARRVYLYSNDSVDSESADEMWKRWLKRDIHPAVDASKQYNGSSPEILMLKDVMKGLRSGETALDKAQYDLSRAQRNLNLAIRLLTMNGTEHLLTEIKDILKKLTRDLRREAGESRNCSQVARRSQVRGRKVQEEKEKKRLEDGGYSPVRQGVYGQTLPADRHHPRLRRSSGPAGYRSHAIGSVRGFDLSVMSEPESGSEPESASDAEPEEDPESESEESYEDEYDRKLQERRNQAILAEHHPIDKIQTKLVLGRVGKSRRILTRSKRDRSVSADYEPESEIEHTTSVRRNPKRKAKGLCTTYQL